MPTPSGFLRRVPTVDTPIVAAIALAAILATGGTFKSSYSFMFGTLFAVGNFYLIRYYVAILIHHRAVSIIGVVLLFIVKFTLFFGIIYLIVKSRFATASYFLAGTAVVPGAIVLEFIVNYRKIKTGDFT